MNDMREQRDLIREARQLGWTVGRTAKGHLRWVSPAGEVLISSGTGSDWRGQKNHIARMKRCACPPSLCYN